MTSVAHQLGGAIGTGDAGKAAMPRFIEVLPAAVAPPSIPTTPPRADETGKLHLSRSDRQRNLM
ncbi:MAG: hypothetical protein R2855_13555 [Thermomicrobiales bacterium]